LFRRIAKRMSEIGINELTKYRNYIENHEEELKILGQEFLINVTKFFRDPESFEALRTEALPAILGNRKTEDPIKIWVVACSSGEEAYSLAIIVREFIETSGKHFNNIKIFATDIDSEALDIGSRGIYGDEIRKDVSPELLKKYFIRQGNTFRVAPELRKLVVFANHDVLKDPPFSHLDLIICRNMFIYINTMLQRKALKKFHFALKIDSYLMLGPSENIGILKDATIEINRKWKLYRCTSKANIVDRETMLVPLENSVFPKATPSAKDVLHNLSEIFKDTLLEDRKITALIVDKEFNVKQATGSYKNFLNFPEHGFNFNLLKLVPSDLAVALGVAIRSAISQNEKIAMKRVMVHEHTNVRFVNIIIKPYLQQNEFQQHFISVVLEEDYNEPKKSPNVMPSALGGERIQELEQELLDTRQNLQAVIEELETANEELQSTNEEMISTNEELQSTNEELQSLNEELHTVSVEHQLKIKELFEVNDDLNNYFNNSEIGQVILDQKMTIRKFSPSARQMINLIEADIGRSIVDITVRLKNLNFVSEIKNVIDTGHSVEKEVATVDNRYFLLRISPFIRRDRAIDGVIINFVDISQVKRLNSIVEGIFESSTNGITAKKAIRNSENQIIDFEYLAINEAAERMFQVEPGTLRGKRLLQTFRDAKEEYFRLYVKVVETGEPLQLEFYHETTHRWYETTVVKMMDGVVTTHMDVTDKRKNADLFAKNFEDLKSTSKQLSDTNTQLERSNFDLLQFASVASHDLKEPLRKIQAFGNILQSKIQNKLTDSELTYLSKMVSASNRMQILIEDVLTLSKLSNSGLAKEETDLNKIIKQICEDLEIGIREKNASVSIGALPTIDAVPGQMHQVFQNLISNALKFSNKTSPQISIVQRPISKMQAKELNINPNNFIQIVVSDDGIGFENQYKEKIFGIFQRLHGRNYEGTGIGLSIARKIIENHGGLIYANGILDKGAEFHIILPVTTAGQPSNGQAHQISTTRLQR
jgi:two-component system, chemotaxis family, CheB/CheR fusion protein